MLCSPARTGRHRQRYMDEFRLVAGSVTQSFLPSTCIPFKFEKVVQDDICDLEKRLLVLMISSPNRDDLVFPKGGWEDDETITEAACREALEEGGVKGILRSDRIVPHLDTNNSGKTKEEKEINKSVGATEHFSEEPLGDWEFRSKSSQNSCSVGGGCRGFMFALEVTEELDYWPEQDIYDRKWLTIDEAFKFCRYDWMREALKRLLMVLSEGSGTEETGEELVEFSRLSVSDAQADQTLSPLYFGKPSGVQHLDESCSKCAVLG
ncbi:hypothetical protein HYC85_006235 [Camellia sinensis]|uniref:Nudix hydrolase domain-containing protein n=1 Tax=Camellia sinensis TaxID=4442 RepID=A0A7J7HKZ7_CAMSI|nr:hypothetical protein HYC85_006235 [Camellia sinensis]